MIQNISETLFGKLWGIHPKCKILEHQDFLYHKHIFILPCFKVTPISFLVESCKQSRFLNKNLLKLHQIQGGGLPYKSDGGDRCTLKLMVWYLLGCFKITFSAVADS